MARLPRLYAPGLPQLVQAKFATPLAATGTPAPAATLNQLAGWIGEEAGRHRVSIHGWALAYDQVLLLGTPADAQSFPRLIQALGRNLAGQLRGGRVFTGRYRSALLEPAVWVLPALVWVETLPLRSGIAQEVETWPWSSASGHTGAFTGPQSWLTDHADYWACGNTPFDRQARYRQRLQEGLSQEQARRIAEAVHGQWALGGPAFLDSLGHTASRRVQPGKRGRPRKTPVPAA